jgi:hypothetical protein
MKNSLMVPIGQHLFSLKNGVLCDERGNSFAMKFNRNPRDGGESWEALHRYKKLIAAILSRLPTPRMGGYHRITFLSPCTRAAKKTVVKSILKHKGHLDGWQQTVVIFPEKIPSGLSSGDCSWLENTLYSRYSNEMESVWAGWELG